MSSVDQQRTTTQHKEWIAVGGGLCVWWEKWDRLMFWHIRSAFPRREVERVILKIEQSSISSS